MPHSDFEIERAKIDFVFRAYMTAINNDWQNRYEALLKLADECGDRVFWSETCGAITPREWLIWAFKEHWQKEKYEMGAEKVMKIIPENDTRLFMGIRDLDGVAKRMRIKANMKD